MDVRWFGDAFHLFEATYETDLDFAMAVLREETHVDNNEEKKRRTRVGTYFGMRDSRKYSYWNCCTLKIFVAILTLILWQTGSQCRTERTGVRRQNQGIWATTWARVFYTSWMRVRFETDVPARRELQKSSREPNIAAAIVLEAPIARDARMWHNARLWREWTLTRILIISEKGNYIEHRMISILFYFILKCSRIVSVWGPLWTASPNPGYCSELGFISTITDIFWKTSVLATSK